MNTHHLLSMALALGLAVSPVSSWAAVKSSAARQEQTTRKGKKTVKKGTIPKKSAKGKRKDAAKRKDAPKQTKLPDISQDVARAALAKNGIEPDAYNTELRHAAGEGNIKKLYLLLRAGADARASDSPLDNAADSERLGSGHLEAVKMLIEAGANINGNGAECFSITPMHQAAQYGHTQILEYMMDAGGLFDDELIAPSLFSWTTYAAEAECLRLLLNRGAKPNPDALIDCSLNTGQTVDIYRAYIESGTVKVPQRIVRQTSPELHRLVRQHVLHSVDTTPGSASKKGKWSQLHSAVYRGDLSQVKKLIKKNADVKEATTIGEAYGITPLHVAAHQGNIDIIQTLLAAGADPNARDAFSYPPLQWAIAAQKAPAVQALLAAGADPNLQDTQKETPLHWAARAGLAEAARALINAKANVNAEQQWHASPLYFAANAETARVLLEAGAKPKIDSCKGDSPLSSAAEAGKADVVSVLLEASPWPKEEISAALRLAAGEGFLDVVQLLLQHGIDLRGEFAQAGADALSSAAHSYYHYQVEIHPKIISLLLKAGANPNLQSKDGNYALIEASDPHAAQALLKAGADPNVRDKNGDTALTRQAGWGNDCLLRMLIKAGADVNARNNSGQSALYSAAAKGKTEICQKLIDAGADVNAAAPPASYNESTPLLQAISNEHACITRMLLKAGARYNDKGQGKTEPLRLALDKRRPDIVKALACAAMCQAGTSAASGWTELHAAALAGDGDKAAELIAGGADLNAAPTGADGKPTQITPLHVAAAAGQLEIVNALLAAGANPSAAEQHGWTPLHVASSTAIADALLTAKADPNAQDQFGNTALLMTQDADLARRLIQAGANVNRQSKKGISPLHMAVAQHNLALIDILAEAKADPNLPDDQGNTALHLAVERRDNAPITQKLLALGAKPNLQNKAGNTPLAAMLDSKKSYDAAQMQLLLDAGADVNSPSPIRLATQHNNVHAIKMLLKAGASVKDIDGETPLLALPPQQISMTPVAATLRVLIKAGADVNAKDKEGKSVLEEHLTRPGSCAESIRILIEAGADVKVKNKEGESPLHFALSRASHWDSAEILQALLKRGAEVNAKNNEGKTALDLAEDYPACLEVLLDAGAKKGEEL